MNVSYKKKGFGNQEAWAGGVRRALISTTYGKQQYSGAYRIQFLPSRVDTYANTLAEARHLVEDYVQELPND